MKTKKMEKVKEVKSRQYLWALRQLKRGLCYYCTARRSKRSKRYCDRHLAIARVRARVRLGYSPGRAAAPGKFKVGRPRLGGERVRLHPMDGEGAGSGVSRKSRMPAIN